MGISLHTAFHIDTILASQQESNVILLTIVYLYACAYACVVFRFERGKVCFIVELIGIMRSLGDLAVIAVIAFIAAGAITNIA